MTDCLASFRQPAPAPTASRTGADPAATRRRWPLPPLLTPMPLRLSLLLLLVLAPLAACQWEGRPDGAEAVHSASDGYYEPGVEPTDTPLGGGPLVPAYPVDAEIVEPLDPNAPLPDAAPVPQTRPAPTSGTEDTISPVEEAPTPGTDQ